MEVFSLKRIFFSSYFLPFFFSVKNIERCFCHSVSVIVSFRMLNKSDLVTMLQKCVEILVSSPGREFDEIVEKLKEFLTRFQKLEGGCASSYVPLQIELKLFCNQTNGYFFFPGHIPSLQQAVRYFKIVLKYKTQLGRVYMLYWFAVHAFLRQKSDVR